MLMCQMLLSINPEYVESIMLGYKKFEFRKVRCRENVEKIIIYATSPVMRIVGEVEVLGIIEDNPDVVWNLTENYSGISRRFYNTYYEGRKKAVAYRLGEVKKYSRPKTLSDYGLHFAPQSFVYV